MATLLHLTPAVREAIKDARCVERHVREDARYAIALQNARNRMMALAREELVTPNPEEKKETER